MLHLILLIVAAVCFALDAFGFGSGRVKLLPLGLLFWVLVSII